MCAEVQTGPPTDFTEKRKFFFLKQDLRSSFLSRFVSNCTIHRRFCARKKKMNKCDPQYLKRKTDRADFIASTPSVLDTCVWFLG